jgi:hypothetical protein
VQRAKRRKAMKICARLSVFAQALSFGRCRARGSDLMNTPPLPAGIRPPERVPPLTESS